MLGQHLRDAEARLLFLDEDLAIGDSVRDFGSLVFLCLTGTIAARLVLEAIVAHSDNTATNAAPGRVDADRERALVGQAELPSIRIPDTTRIFQTYIAGASPGADLGWPAIAQAFPNPPGPLRPLLNDVVTFAGTARDFVS